MTPTVKGTGNFAALSAPVLRHPDGFKIYDAQRKTSGESGEGRWPVFEQVLIPLSEGVDRIGPYELSYFDPVAEYKTARSEAIPLTVTPRF